MVDPIVTTGDLDAYLGGDKQQSLDAATAAVRVYCGWHVTPVVTETVTLDVEGCTALLPSLHVLDLEAVKVDGEDVPRGNGYEWSQAGILRVHARRGFRVHARRGFRKLEATMTHGYEDAPDVAGVILAAAARSVLNPSGVSRSQVGQISETYSQAGRDPAVGAVLNSQEKAILDRYKLPSRP